MEELTKKLDKTHQRVITGNIIVSSQKRVSITSKEIQEMQTKQDNPEMELGNSKRWMHVIHMVRRQD